MDIKGLFQKIYRIFHPYYEMSKEDSLRKELENYFSTSDVFYIKNAYYTKNGFRLSLGIKESYLEKICEKEV